MASFGAVRQIPAAKALSVGLVDHVVGPEEGDVVQAAVAFAERRLPERLDTLRSRNRRLKVRMIYNLQDQRTLPPPPLQTRFVFYIGLLFPPYFAVTPASPPKHVREICQSATPSTLHHYIHVL